jgi:hypothetical protein
MTILQISDLPKENKPDFKNIKNECYMLENINLINKYKKFNDIIIQPYKKLFKDEYKSNFELTCNHMFKKVGFGVFVYILKGKIHTYQIFANTTEIKPGSKNITRKKINNIKKRFLHIQTKILHRPKINMMYTKKKWGFGNCMFNNLNNWWKNNLYINVYFDMLNTCIKDTHINTCFFINLYDYPVLYNKQCDQYILSSIKCKNNKLQPNNYIPVLSGSTTKEHYDKCLVYVDAWEIVTQKKFGKNCSNKYYNILDNINQNWKEKENTLIFRGANSSCYPNDFVKNDRLKVLSILKNIMNNNDSININIDAGLVNVTAKPIVINNTIDISDPELILKKLDETEFKQTVTMPDQSNNKYILDIDGYVTPWRLCFELNYNSCIILILSKYYSWFYDKLEHMKNIYIIDIDSKHLEKDLYDALMILQKNDKLGKKIAKGSTELYDEIMNIDYMKNYMNSLLLEPEFDIMNTIE